MGVEDGSEVVAGLGVAEVEPVRDGVVPLIGGGGPTELVRPVLPTGGGGAEDRRVPLGAGAVDRLGAGAVDRLGAGARDVADPLATEFGSGARLVDGVFARAAVVASDSFSIWRSIFERLTGSFSCIALAKASSRFLSRSRNAWFSGLSFGLYALLLGEEPRRGVAVSSSPSSRYWRNELARGRLTSGVLSSRVWPGRAGLLE
jgi:hypothetical protein